MTRPAPGWRVAVEAHDVARWTIDAATLEVWAPTARDARVAAAREAHRRAGVPGWKPWLRATFLRTRVLGTVEDHLDPARARRG